MRTAAGILSNREAQIASQLALGHTRKEISDSFFISEGTTISHIKNIYAKTGCHNLADITRFIISKSLSITTKDIYYA